MLSGSAIGDDRKALLRKACEELQSRLRSGEACHVETLLSAYPTLASEPQLALDLILTEWAVRRELGQEPNLEELVRRFPPCEEALRRKFDELANSTGSMDSFDAAATVPKNGAGSSVTMDGPIPALGGHELFEEVGRGNMGIVFRARDKVLDRIVALKRIRAGVLAEAQEVKRFYIEARAAAQLKHPNIVPIYGMGHFEGEHCFTMEWVPGGSLADHLDRYAGDARAAAGLIEKAARAVHAAHEKKIIHRDLKPANILLTARGEPLVSDFGLAKLPDTSADLTIPGQLMGTPSYMSPEQAAGEAWNVTPATDVWALGAILYEMTTGKRPFRGSDAKGVLKRVLEAAPPSPRSVKPSVDEGLDKIILGCLRKNPAERYASAAAFADDLGRWLRHEKVHPPQSSSSRPGLTGASQRHVWIVAASIVLPLALLVVIGALLVALGPSRKSPPEPAPIVCLGPDGFTTGGNWILGGGTIKAVDEETVQLESNSKSPAIVSLAAAPPWDRYRVRSKVLDLSDNRNVGICVALHQQSLAHGMETWFCELSFAERNDGMNPVAKKMQAQGIARIRRYVEPNASNLPADAYEALSTPRWFDANPGTWRSLAVDVTPEVINFYWADEALPLISVPFTPTLDDHRKFLANLPPFPFGESLALNPKGGVGLLCEGGKVQFRSVVIEPLPESKP